MSHVTRDKGWQQNLPRIIIDLLVLALIHVSVYLSSGGQGWTTSAIIFIDGDAVDVLHDFWPVRVHHGRFMYVPNGTRNYYRQEYKYGGRRSKSFAPKVNPWCLVVAENTRNDLLLLVVIEWFSLYIYIYLLGPSGSGRRVRSPRVKEWHKGARLIECKCGSSDGITARLRYADASPAVYRQATA